MSAIVDWFDNRTGIRAIVHAALFEHIPGGARWRYAWGSTLVFAFVTQAVTGFFLWMAYSPSSQSAWESVYYIQHVMQYGWLVRGIHHFMAQAMIVLLVLHLAQVVIDGAYRAPREVNFWLGLILMQLVLALGLTGYLLPWDQKGYWATAVATNLMIAVPGIGEYLQKLVVGGEAYGHHTLTRFFALHAGLLPALLVGFLVLHLAIFRRHGIHAAKPKARPDGVFWPDQILRDAIACLVVLAVVLFLVFKPFILGEVDGSRPGSHFGAELGPPADGSRSYDSARPEWYFLFLFQLLKYFHGETGEFIGAIVIPGAVMLFLFLMPIIGRWNLGHRFNVVMLIMLLVSVGILTGLALYDDRYALVHARPVEAKNDVDKEKLTEAEKRKLERWEKSKAYLDAVKQAELEAERAVVLAERGIPPGGMLTVLGDDPKLQGPGLFKQHCAACHSHSKDGEGIVADEVSAPNLYGFASRAWIAGILDPELIVSDDYFGKSPHAEMDMVTWVTDTVPDMDPEDIEKIVAALSAQAALASQAEIDIRDAEKIAEGTKLIKESGCIDCHKFGEAGSLGIAPDLTGYGSQEWLVGMISNPNHERFYGHAFSDDPEENRQPMPAFAATPGSPNNVLTEQELDLIVHWLRGEWYEPEGEEGEVAQAPAEVEEAEAEPAEAEAEPTESEEEPAPAAEASAAQDAEPAAEDAGEAEGSEPEADSEGEYAQTARIRP